jgi:hypothetical protein
VAVALLAGAWVFMHRESPIEKMGRGLGESVYEHYYRFGNRTTTCADYQDKDLFARAGADFSWHELYVMRQACEKRLKELIAERGPGRKPFDWGQP